MDFYQILKHTWTLFKSYRVALWLGVLIALTGGSFSLFSTPYSPPTSPSHTKIFEWVFHHIPLLMVLILSFILIYVAIFYISYTAKASLIILAHKEGNKGHRIGFKKLLSQGEQFFWRLFGVTALKSLIIGLVLVAVIAVSATALVIYHTQALFFLIPFWIVSLVACITLIGYLGMLSALSERIIVIKNQRMLAAIKEAHQLLIVQPNNSLIAYLLGLGIGMAGGVCSALILVPATVLFSFIGSALYTINPNAAAIYTFTAGFSFLLISLLIGGVITAFISLYWTVSYQAITYIAEH